MIERLVSVPPGVGLHARPASLLVQAAADAAISVTVGRPDGAPVNATSILALLGLDVRGGEQVVLRADGPGAEEALDRIARVVTALPPQDGPPQDGPPQDGPPQDGPPEDGAPADG